MNHLTDDSFPIRCMIDFLNSPALTGRDIIFHTSIRPSDKVVVRNHLQNGSWGAEERYGACQVRKNETFEIVILAELLHYKIAINGHHLGVFRHRMPLHLVQYVHVDGDVTIDHILLEQDFSQVSPSHPINMPIHTHPTHPTHPHMPIHAPMHPYQPPPPPYYPPHHQPHSVSNFSSTLANEQVSYNFQTITRIGPITIEQQAHAQPGTIIIQQRRHRRHVIRF